MSAVIELPKKKERGTKASNIYSTEKIQRAPGWKLTKAIIDISARFGNAPSEVVEQTVQRAEQAYDHYYIGVGNEIERAPTIFYAHARDSMGTLLGWIPGIDRALKKSPLRAAISGPASYEDTGGVFDLFDEKYGVPLSLRVAMIESLPPLVVGTTRNAEGKTVSHILCVTETPGQMINRDLLAFGARQIGLKGLSNKINNRSRQGVLDAMEFGRDQLSSGDDTIHALGERLSQVTRYGGIAQEKLGITTTTGHGATTWAIEQTCLKLAEAMGIEDLSTFPLAVVGLGAIGTAATISLGERIKDIVAYDIIPSKFAKFERRVTKEHPHLKGHIYAAESPQQAVKYARFAIGAVSAAQPILKREDFLDEDGARTCAMVEDSQPPGSSDGVWPVLVGPPGLHNENDFHFGPNGLMDRKSLEQKNVLNKSSFWSCHVEGMATAHSFKDRVTGPVLVKQVNAIGKLLTEQGFEPGPLQSYGRPYQLGQLSRKPLPPVTDLRLI